VSYHTATASRSLYKQKNSIHFFIGKNTANVWLCVKDAWVYAVREQKYVKKLYLVYCMYAIQT